MSTLMLFMSLGFPSSYAETIIVGENATPPASLVINTTPTTPIIDNTGIPLSNLTQEDFKQYTVALNDLGNDILQYLQFESARGNRTDKILQEVIEQRKSQDNITQTLTGLVTKQNKEISQLNRNILNTQNKVDTLEGKFPIYITVVGVISLFFGVVLTNLAITFRNSGKFFTFIRWVRSWYPFNIDVQSADETTKSKPNYIMIGLVGGCFLLIIIALVI